MKKALISITALLCILLLAACGNEDSGAGDNEDESKSIKFGATVGPYSDMVTKALAPLLEEKGYEVENQEFTDYVQPNNALSRGDIDANLFQHTIYLEAFAEENEMDLSSVIAVPTAPMGLYSNTFATTDEIAEGSTIAIANDPTNLSRTLLMLQDQGLITISKEVDPLKASLKDIVENPKNLEFVEVEAGQLPRLVDSEDAAAVPGNFALAADMDLLDALALEEMPDNYRNVVAVNTDDLDAQFTKDIKEVIESDEFEQIIDEEFQGFGKPGWMTEE
ncbi:D-methionine-binding lipoprotein MetQ precursor [Oceanobacillus picturae]|uniref:Lipoprotein n=1 Tax=Oceanobacillus picturae TaxID=171693 RepID=A0A0U9HZW9_9BACI|nr:MetQ/NlpA family ABC transporter substrate-binding protein [Oceanobacillus picturae]GAQ18285.1 D-methionine-binding lipoprotein MetQ precursor [Oceanobacillus picturae]